MSAPRYDRGGTEQGADVGFWITVLGIVIGAYLATAV